MKNADESAWHSVWQLFRFLFWYVVVAAGVLYLLPVAGLFLENSYDQLGNAVRLLAVVGFVIAITAWQLFAARDRWRRTANRKKAI